MKSLFCLCKVELQALLSALNMGGRGKKRQKAATGVLAALLMGALMAYMGVVYCGPLAQVLVPLGLGDLLWCMMLLMAFAMCLCFTIFSGSGMLFSGRDLDFLFALPLPAWVVLAAKLLALYLENLLFSVCLLLPAGVTYAVVAGSAGAGFWLGLVAACLCTPLLATVLSGVLGALMAYISGHFRHKNLAAIVVGVAGFGVVMWSALSLQNYLGSASQMESLRDILARALPPFAWAASALSGGAFLGMAGYAALCLGLAALFAALLAPFYQPLALRLATRSVQSNFKMGRQAAGGAFGALFKKEAARFFGTPIYFLNAGIGSLLLAGAGVYLLVAPGQIAQLALMPGMADLIAPAAAGCLGFCLLVANPSSVSISLEGKNFWLLQTAPVSAGTVLGAKAALGIVVNLPGLVLAIAGVWTAFGFDLALGAAFGAVVAGLAIFSALLGLFINLLLPRFDAPNDTVVVKQSASVLACMGISFAVVLAAGGVWMLLKPAPTLFLAACAAVVWALNALLALWLQTKGPAQLKALGER